MPRKKTQHETAQPKQKRAHGEGTIYKRKDGRFMIRVMVDGEQVTRYTSDEKEAERIRRQLVHMAEQGSLITARQQTLKAHMEQWLEMRRTDWRMSTYSCQMRNAINHIFPKLGSVTLQKLTPEKIEVFYGDLLKKGLQASMVRLIHGTLKQSLNAAVRWKKIATNPCIGVKLPRVQKEEYTILDAEGVRTLLDSIKGHWLYEGLLTLALATGMRRGELLGLTWNDIDFEQKQLRVERTRSLVWNPDTKENVVHVAAPKTEHSRRTIALPDFALEALRRHRMQQMEMRLKAKDWQEHDAVFCNQQGNFFWPNDIDARLKHVLKKAKLPAMRFHDLRHSAATILLEMDVPAKVVQERLGHSDITITLRIYGHVTKKMEYKATLALDEAFNNQTKHA